MAALIRHKHPGGQVLLVTGGKGFFQEEGEPAQAIREGDVVKIYPGVKHWHGAVPGSWLVHISITPNAQKGDSTWPGSVTLVQSEIPGGMRIKVLLVNGSPHKNGCTYTALTEVAKTLKDEGIETEIFWIGIKPLAGCIACNTCAETGHCAFKDRVNDFLDIAGDADGFIFGSPVHYAAASGAITSFMDRVFYADLQSGKQSFYLKPAAAIVSAERAGTTAAIDQLNKYFTFSEMPVISSRYWNMVHGSKPEDVKKDLEGLQVMRVLARNMAFFLKCQESGLKAGVPLPTREQNIYTYFIRE